ncbi:MAG: DUF4398 domain-containing protein [Proteobacteria bacterium]|nr:DUF4398 domain-containing protein [Pseudomonadota bacterium]
MRVYYILLAIGGLALADIGCAPMEYTAILSSASQAIGEAAAAGASCTTEQLDRRSPATENVTPDPGTQLASSDESSTSPKMGQPMCSAPYEYYMAVEYLRQARVEVGYSEYEAALGFAREAQSFARKARDIALDPDREGGR